MLGAVSAPVSIVVPVRNEAAGLARLLASLRALVRVGDVVEIVVVDGESADGTAAIAAEWADVVIRCDPGRGGQLRAGAERSSGRTIWMLHADAEVSREVWATLIDAAHRSLPWGRFDVRLTSQGWPFRVIETAMNWRSRLTGICTGDQGIFVRRDVLERAGGIPAQRLMEDVELCRRLKRLARPVGLRPRIGASARRWQVRGVLRTVVTMWELRLCYFFGASPDALADRYYRETDPESADGA